MKLLEFLRDFNHYDIVIGGLFIFVVIAEKLTLAQKRLRGEKIEEREPLSNHPELLKISLPERNVILKYPLVMNVLASAFLIGLFSLAPYFQ